METNEITKEELRKKLGRKEGLILINVLSTESYESMRIPGSVNAPADDPDFLQKVQQLVADKGKAIVVYGPSNASPASKKAADALMAAGYENVLDFRGGMADWIEGSYPIERDKPPEYKPPHHGPPVKKSEEPAKEGEEGGEGKEAAPAEGKPEPSALAEKRCKPCEGGVAPLDEAKAQEMLKEAEGWELKGNRIVREIKFKDFKEAMHFVDWVADIAEEQGHHPDIYISFDKIRLALWTHAIGGLSENDFIMAAKINRI